MTTFEKMKEHLSNWTPALEDLAPTGMSVEYLGAMYGESIDFLCDQIDERDRLIEDLTRRLVNLEQRVL